MLQGKSALVTGSTSGIGAGIATALAEAGANVMLNGFGDAAEIERLRAALAERTGVRVRHSAADMSKPVEIAAMVAQAEAQFGRLDVLSTTLASSTSRQSTSFRKRSGNRSWPSTCRPTSMRFALRCRA